MSRPVMPTRAPIAASPAAVALPIPPVPPVTRTVLSAIGPVLMPAIAYSFTLRAAGFLALAASSPSLVSCLGASSGVRAEHEYEHAQGQDRGDDEQAVAEERV